MTYQVYRNFALWMTILAPIAVAAEAEKKETPTEHRLRAAGVVFDEILASGDKGVPQGVLNRTLCIVIVPGVRNELVKVGAQRGKGFLICKTADLRDWSAPAAVQLDYPSADSDLIVLAVSGKSASTMMNSKLTLEGVVAGPIGRDDTPATDLLAYTRMRGALAGIALSGVIMRQDAAGNRDLYGRTQDNQEIVQGQTTPPRASRRLFNALTRFAPEEAVEKH